VISRNKKDKYNWGRSEIGPSACASEKDLNKQKAQSVEEDDTPYHIFKYPLPLLLLLLLLPLRLELDILLWALSNPIYPRLEYSGDRGEKALGQLVITG
jgi:hypothetical protein